jgi:rRNA maturation RNase YbeY
MKNPQKINIAIDGRLPASFGVVKKYLFDAALFFAAKSAKRSKLAFRSISIILQTDEESDCAHRAIMNVEGATDVITQPFDPMPGEEDGVYGELYVNYERAESFASKRKNWTPLKELLLYLAHGMDHLSGESDMTRDGRARMRRRELLWLKEWFEKEGTI